MENLGLLAALGAALLWGSYVTPFKISKSKNLLQFQAVMTIGVFIFALIVSLIFKFPLNFNFYAILSGAMWAFANALSLVVISDLGISRGVSIWVSLVILTSFLWGALFFRELPAGLPVGLLGIALIILGVILVSTTGNLESKNSKRGFALAVLSGVVFGSQFVPLKLSNLAAADFFFPMSFGIMATGLNIAFLKQVRFRNTGAAAAFLSGVIWNFGNLLAIAAISLIGLAKGFPITQVSVLVAVLWGLFYFREITQKKKVLQVLAGAVILLAGVAVLGLA